MDRRRRLALSATGAWVAHLNSTASVVRASDVQSRGSAADGICSIRDFGAVGNGVADDTAAIQRAIDHVRSRADNLQDTSHLPCVVLPAGHYRLTDTIRTAPWIKLCSAGSVLLDFTQLPLDRDGIVCRNEIMAGPGELRYPGNRSPFLDGAAGTISLLGPGAARSNGWGIVTGNSDARFPGAVRDAGGRNVVVTGWRGALCIDPVNTYLNAWLSCRFEQNREAAIHVRTLQGLAVNSGERMTFHDCTFAGSQRALSVDAGSQDFVFDACSFDFNGDVIYFGPQARYGTVALSHCHIEGIDGLLVNASDGGKRLRMAIDHSIVLPRRWKQKAQANSPRQLVAGRFRFSAIAVEFRFEAPLRDMNEALIGEEVHVEALNGLSFPGVEALPSYQRCLNADPRFCHDASGTAVSGLTHWKPGDGVHRVAQASIRRLDTYPPVRSPDEAAQALVLRSPPAGNASFALSAKSPFPAQPGETICAAIAVSCDGIAGRSSVLIDFFDAGGQVLAQAATMGTSHADVAILRAIAPAGVSQGVLHTAVADWSGDLLVNSLVAWRIA